MSRPCCPALALAAVILSALSASAFQLFPSPPHAWPFARGRGGGGGGGGGSEPIHDVPSSSPFSPPSFLNPPPAETCACAADTGEVSRGREPGPGLLSGVTAMRRAVRGAAARAREVGPVR